MFKRIRSRLTMEMKYSLFYDHIEGKNVYLWEDCYGVEWMAQTKYGFRVLYSKGNVL
jgi:hypothetical protein